MTQKDIIASHVRIILSYFNYFRVRQSDYLPRANTTDSTIVKCFVIIARVKPSTSQTEYSSNLTTSELCAGLTMTLKDVIASHVSINLSYFNIEDVSWINCLGQTRSGCRHGNLVQVEDAPRPSENPP